MARQRDLHLAGGRPCLSPPHKTRRTYLDAHRPLEEAMGRLRGRLGGASEPPRPACPFPRGGRSTCTWRSRSASSGWPGSSRSGGVTRPEARERQGHGETAPGRTLREIVPGASKATDAVAEVAGVSGRYVSDAKRVAAEAPDLVEGPSSGAS